MSIRHYPESRKLVSWQLDLKILSILLDQLHMVMVHWPLLWEVFGLHAVQEMLPPASFQLHKRAQASFSTTLHHLQSMWHVALIADPARTQAQFIFTQASCQTPDLSPVNSKTLKILFSCRVNWQKGKLTKRQSYKVCFNTRLFSGTQLHCQAGFSEPRMCSSLQQH